MRTRLVVGAVTGALVGIVLVTGGAAAAGPLDPTPQPSPAPTTAPATTTAAPSPQPIISPILVSSPTQATQPTAEPTEEATTRPAEPTSTRVAVATPTRTRTVTTVPTAVVTTRGTVPTYTTNTDPTTNDVPFDGAAAPTDYAATDPGTITLTASLTPGADGKASPVLVERTARTTKKLGHFSVTDLLLVLIFSATGVAIAGAGGLWVTRR